LNILIATQTRTITRFAIGITPPSHQHPPQNLPRKRCWNPATDMTSTESRRHPCTMLETFELYISIANRKTASFPFAEKTQRAIAKHICIVKAV